VKKPTKHARPKRRTPSAVPKTKPSPTADDARSADRSFPIVGIGASAGGLEALELFLQNVPADSGLAFVIVQHLDPTHKGLLPELLQRSTTMKVMQVRDGTGVQPDCVYVIPPNSDMSILHGVLHLLDPAAPRGLRLPVDFFFRSLADDADERSIGVVLSGMGTDGTLGLKAIKGKAGVVFVQDPSSAKFDGMPRSAIEAGLADAIAPAEALPGKILAYLQHVPLLDKGGSVKEDKSQGSFAKILILLRAQTGHDFSFYKKNTLYRRIERRMGIHQIDRIATYVRFLQGNPQELELLFKELLISVTSFFRDSASWDQVTAEVLPALLKDRPPTQALRIWVPGCATGEEAYSLAIVVKEVLERLGSVRDHGVQIFATDLDRDAIDKARTGMFPANIAADVSPERLSQFFVKLDRGYQVTKPVREMVIFAAQNVILDPPFTRLDLVSCRNLFIYLTPELQKKLLALFHYSLNPGGMLFLGNAETIGGSTSLFEPLRGAAQLYQRLQTDPGMEPVEFPSPFTPHRPAPQKVMQPTVNLQTEAEQFLLQRYSPAAVLVNNKGDILFISGRTGKYLEPAVGKANWNIFAMAREGLHPALTSTFRKALRQHKAVTLGNVPVGTDGGVQAIDLTVQTIQEPEALRGLVMVVFADVATPPEAKSAPNAKRPRGGSLRTVALEQELEQIREELHTTRAEMQVFEEEAQSANEELQSTNEELQSTNEELTTSKEEMQSMNEELQTLNAELHQKVDDQARLNNDMRNLLDSTEIATVFLDAGLRVRLFTPESNRIFKLLPSDVGRPITDIASGMRYPELADDARAVLRTLAVHDRSVEAHDGRWLQVRIMPYRTVDDVMDGVVITCADITGSKKVETDLIKTNVGLEKRIEEQDAEPNRGGKARPSPAGGGGHGQDSGRIAGLPPERKIEP